MSRSVLTLVTPPATEPVSLTAAKEWLRIDGAEEDAVITSLVIAARQAAEEYLRRSLVTQTWRLSLSLCGSGRGDFYPGVYELPVNYFDGGLPRTIELPKGPISSVTSISTYDLSNVSTVFAPSNYRLDASGGRVILNSGAYWPSGIRPDGGCEVTYVAGYGTSASVPQPIKTGILIHAASLYEQRGMCDDAMALPPGAESFYARYRIMGDRRG